MKRGDTVIIVLPRDYGKPRPGLIIQSDLFLEINSVTVIPLTSHIIDAPLLRISIEPSALNGLHVLSQAMIDKIYTTPRAKVGEVIGRIDRQTLVTIERAIALFIGVA
jgi:mRNA interferase MazF